MGIRPGYILFLFQCASTIGMTATYNASDQVTLKAAIDNANSSGTADTINVTANIVIDGTLIGSPFVADGDNGMPSITTSQPLIIDGGGFTIERDTIMAPSFRIFHIDSAASVTVRNLTLKGGFAENNAGDALGGGIYNLGALTIEDSVFDSNRADGTRSPATFVAGGGAIYHADGSLAIARTQFIGNAVASSLLQRSQPIPAFGGAIYATSPATLGDIIDSSFEDNLAGAGPEAAAFGGAIAMNNVGANSITNSLFLNNVAQGGSTIFQRPGIAGAGFGGAIYQEGGTTAEVSFCTFDGNQALGGDRLTGGTNGADGIGGGIALVSASITELKNSTLSSNRAIGSDGGPQGSSGGGIYLQDSTISINNSTLSGNLAQDKLLDFLGFGGGLELFGASTATLIANTITRNTAVSDIGGGGIHIGLNATIDVLKSNIVADNLDEGTAAGQDIADDSLIPPLAGTLAIASAFNNLIGVDLYSGLTNGVMGNIVGTVAEPIDPALGILANNGGPTKTHRLFIESPAVDKGLNPIPTAFDQRGPNFLREVPAGFPDIGAYEIQAGISPCPPCPTCPKRSDEEDDDGGGRDFSNDNNYWPTPPFPPVLGPPMPVPEGLPMPAAVATVVKDVPTLLGVESKAKLNDPSADEPKETPEGGCSAGGNSSPIFLLLMMLFRFRQKRLKAN